MVIVNNFKEYKAYLGTQIGASHCHIIDQEQITKFAGATLDFQLINVNQNRARPDIVFDSTIAHGYLTLSLIPFLWKQIAEIRNMKIEVNYGQEQYKKPLLKGSFFPVLAFIFFSPSA